MRSACPHMVLAHDHGSAFGNASVKSCEVRRRLSRPRPCASRLQNLWRSCGDAVVLGRRTRPDPRVMPSDDSASLPGAENAGRATCQIRRLGHVAALVSRDVRWRSNWPVGNIRAGLSLVRPGEFEGRYVCELFVSLPVPRAR
jgi:hypothetical protein